MAPPSSLKQLIEQVSSQRILEAAPLEQRGLTEPHPFPFLALVGQTEMKVALMLALINPAFNREWIRYFTVFRDRFAQPICLTDYRETTPRHATPATNLFVTDSCQLHPHDRSISGSFGLGRVAATEALASLGRA